VWAGPLLVGPAATPWPWSCRVSCERVRGHGRKLLPLPSPTPLYLLEFSFSFFPFFSFFRFSVITYPATVCLPGKSLPTRQVSGYQVSARPRGMSPGPKGSAYLPGKCLATRWVPAH
jgi:hypothetical protein